ncbi:Emopamil-binding protein [Emericellopsis atlantica]|uniref:Emopamil-binding protein n=1 Tax=Emericellopsis atlantica TaxID=2614577 RepID=A0A9P8CLY8_9HYPO|nr:Emopamil-binding protein [Emericellopsis atlantica]KAG9251517.1 Emopamil-binding protein [Emericellopsis atlantica]
MASHPYYPPTAAIPLYTPNATPTIQTIAIFGAIVGAVVVVAYNVLPTGSRFIDRFSASWFALCAFLHLCFEGYYVVHRAEIAGMNTLFAQLWKEYTLSDSRYLTLDTFTVCIEYITLICWGPLSLLTLLAIIKKHDLRHPLQIIVCTAHLYGVALYYATSEMDVTSYSRPEALYYWVYYVGFNAPWATVPFWLLWDSVGAISNAFKASRELEGSRKNI